MDGGASATAPLLSVRGVTRRYGATVALAPVNLDVRPGEFLTILGPSGSGKTTLLRLIGGFVDPSGGAILLDGQDIARTPIEARPFNTVFQDYALFPHMTVAQNVGYGLLVRGRPRAEIRARVAEHLEVVGLAGMEARYPSQLSGGQRQRVALARALICGPRLLLLDEPLAALDAELRRQMQDFLKQLQRRTGVAFLFVTHDQDEAIALSDRICVMSSGRIEQVGTAREVYYRPASRFVATFFGDNNLVEGCRIAADGQSAETPLGRFALAAPEPLAGRRATLCLRPEALVAAPGPGFAGPRFAARVREVDFAGPLTRARLETGAGLVLTHKTFSDPSRPAPRPGAAVEMGFLPEAAAFLPAEGAP